MIRVAPTRERRFTSNTDGSEHIVGVFGRAAATYDRVGPKPFAHFGKRLVELADLGEDDDVLDVAAGRGAVLFPAAAVARRVVGIDLAGPMVAALADEITGRDLDNAEAQVMDANALAFPAASFDAVLCNLSIFFLDLDRALAEFARVLKPGGRLGFTLFGKGDPRWDWHRDLLQSLRGQTPSPAQQERPSLEPLTRAGFDSICVYEESHDLEFADADEWWQWIWSQGQRSALETLDDERLARYRSDAYQRLPDPIVNTWTVVFVLARRMAPSA